MYHSQLYLSYNANNNEIAVTTKVIINCIHLLYVRFLFFGESFQLIFKTVKNKQIDTRENSTNF